MNLKTIILALVGKAKKEEGGKGSSLS